MHRLRHVNYNLLLLRMERSYWTGLRLRNNLTSQIEQFIPRSGKNVKWYTCGPTVYSDSHMGHARNYVCNDMLRKVMRDYFGYNIELCMNITDVEDKIINNSIEQGVEYFEFAQKWEAQFFKDMGELDVELPDSITRVTQYIPEVVEYIKTIIDNKYAYASNGSVYFDIEAFRKKFKYGKLKRIKEAETEEEEGDEKGEKKNKDDFALWKAAKPKEPKWQSPWGQGRPGWHIECSAMACSIMGKKLDIHSGGIDLIFPHHENQVAQVQAHYDQAEWTKYFIHVGHLNINGRKMSKSLKNFITIRQLLEKARPRVIKLYFFLHRYDVVLNYNDKTSLQESTEKDKRYKNLFGALKSRIRDTSIKAPQKFSPQDFQFNNALESSKDKIHEAFCSNIDTPGVITQLDEIIKRVNSYSELNTAKVTLLKKSYQFLMKTFTVMGLDYSQDQVQVDSKEEHILNATLRFRDAIRENAKSDFKKILEICDKFRDYDMVDLEVRLQDKKVGEASTWRYQSKEILVKEREAKEEAKLKKQKEIKGKEQLKLQKMKVNPREMFLKDQKWATFDENGIPTHEKTKDEPKGINGKLRTKLEKEWNTQKDLFEKYNKEFKKEE